ncbi:MAG: hypothetical protein IJ283_05145 [Oscillospiraceae bacterium]|nr:hypothetical protein [Oscillospiraceae bacterium]
MLKNVKFLYSVIAVLLAVCILCGIHIMVDNRMMLERKAHYVNTLCAQTEGVHEWIKTALDENDPSVSLGSAKVCLDALTDTAHVASFYRFEYNELLNVKIFFGGASDFYYNLRHVGERFDEILKNLSEDPVLSEEDRAYLEEAEKAFGAFMEKLETDGVINPDAIKSDTYLSYACMELSDIAR